MNPVAAFPDALSRELCRLHECEVAALASGNLPAFIHSRLRWCELILSLCPGMSPAAPTLARQVAHLLPNPAKPVPAWKLELRARPLVPIVRRVVRLCTLPSGGTCRTATEYLACGHVHKLVVVVDGDLRARRRRCRACGTARLAAVARRDLAECAVPSGNPGGNSVSKGGSVEVPEPGCGDANERPRPYLVPSQGVYGKRV